MERELAGIVAQVIKRATPQKLNRRYRYSDSDIAWVLLWAALHERPIAWACSRRNWLPEFRPSVLPNASTMSRRLRRDTIQELLARVHRRLRKTFRRRCVNVVDGKPLTVSANSRDADARVGRSVGGFAKGYKLHAIIDDLGLIRAWSVTSLNVNEPKQVARMVRSAGIHGYLLGDANYDTNTLHGHCRRQGIQLVAPRRRGQHCGLGHRPQDPGRLRSMALLEQDQTGFGRDLFKIRPNIERVFGNLATASYGLQHLPSWVRSLQRVRNWVAAKIVIVTAAKRQRATR